MTIFIALIVVGGALYYLHAHGYDNDNLTTVSGSDLASVKAGSFISRSAAAAAVLEVRVDKKPAKVFRRV